jgi:predicted metalloprotease with PDZ domain
VSGRLLAISGTLWFSASLFAQDLVRHTLSFPSNREQTIQVHSEFPVQGAVTELFMPGWTPGSYLIRDFAANISRIKVESDDGRKLQIQKAGKDHWVVNTEQVATLVVDYEVFTPSMDVNSSWASRDFILLNGASVFLYTPTSRLLQHRLSIHADQQRGEVFTALVRTGQAAVFLAENYDELLDNPVVIANAPSYRFNVRRQDYVLVNVGENGFWDGKRASDDVRKIVSETQSFWHFNPLTRPYWFLNFAIDSRGGLEHDHSTVIMTGRRQMRNRGEYIKWLGVVAHEFFHVWNVRRMRPAELASYDYQNEQYTTQLWLAEGLSSYYDNLLLSRSGLITPEEYMELLARDIHRLENTPGRHEQSVSEASVDAWVRHYKPNSNSINSTISYYTKGAVIGFVLDTFLRKESRNKHDLDEVMQKMYSLYSDQPYTTTDFENVVKSVGGEKPAELLRSLLESTAELDVDSALSWYGLVLNRDPVAHQAKLNGETLESGFGVIWNETTPNLVVKSVLSGSSGASAGILPEDELLAIGNERVTKDSLHALLTSFRPGESTSVLLARRGRVLTLDLELESAIPERFDILLKSGFKKRHIVRLQSLLGQNLRSEP